MVDKQSGKDFNRASYQTLKTQLLRESDILIIKELDRLGRNKQQIKEKLEELKNKGVIIKILNIPTTLIEIPESNQWVMDMVNNILIDVLGAIAEEERATIRQRQKEGIKKAKEEGKHLGRPKINYKTITKKQKDLIKECYPSWKNKEITAVKFMEMLEMKNNTFFISVKIIITSFCKIIGYFSNFYYIFSFFSYFFIKFLSFFKNFL